MPTQSFPCPPILSLPTTPNPFLVRHTHVVLYQAQLLIEVLLVIQLMHFRVHAAGNKS